MKTVAGLALCAALIGFSQTSTAETMSFLLNPIDSPAKVKKTFAPLSRYIEKSVGKEIIADCENNYLTNWQRLLRENSPDIIIQAAHITGYLGDKGRYKPIATVDGRLSFSLVTASDDLIIAPAELVGSRVATLAAPYLGAILLNNMFPDPIRRPIVKEAADVDSAVKMVIDGKARAAMIPTPILNRYPDMNPIETTDQFPLITVSVNTRLPAEMQDKIASALLSADKNPEGSKMLSALNVARFIPPPDKEMGALATMLRGTHGY